MKLVKPSLKYKDSFWRGLSSLRKENPEAFKEFGNFANANEFVILAKNQEKGRMLPAGWIPHSMYWLVDNEKVVGQSQLRPGLTKFLREVGGQIGYAIFPAFRRQGFGSKILALTLKKTKKFGLQKIVITCDENNIGSKKIIESNGGILEKKSSQGKGLPKKLVYKISIN